MVEEIEKSIFEDSNPSTGINIRRYVYTRSNISWLRVERYRAEKYCFKCEKRGEWYNCLTEVSWCTKKGKIKYRKFVGSLYSLDDMHDMVIPLTMTRRDKIILWMRRFWNL